jgi:hypothetical protein
MGLGLGMRPLPQPCDRERVRVANGIKLNPLNIERRIEPFAGHFNNTLRAKQLGALPVSAHILERKHPLQNVWRIYVAFEGINYEQT